MSGTGGDGMYGHMHQAGFTHGDDINIYRTNGTAPGRHAPRITVLTILIGRAFVFEAWLKSLKSIHYPKDCIDILWIYAGTSKDKFGKMLLSKIASMKGYHQKVLVLNPNLPKYWGEDGKIRHEIICETYNYSKVYIDDTDYTFLLEDDVVIPKDSITKLMKLMDNKRLGCALGHLRYRPCDINHGTTLAWDIKPTYSLRNGSVVHGCAVEALQPLEKGIEEISSGTFGCTLIREPLWREIRLLPYTDRVFGTDVNYGLQLRDKGYKTMIDWSVKCKHYFKKGTKLVYI